MDLGGSGDSVQFGGLRPSAASVGLGRVLDARINKIKLNGIEWN